MATQAQPESLTEKDVDPKPANAATEAAPKQSGVDALNALIAKGPPDPKAVVDIIDAHRSERDAIMARLQATLGNAYVQKVVQAMGLRASVERKEVVDGDPSDPNGGYFLASAEQKGAKWRTKDGDFTGTIDKNGLDATEKLGAHDELHEKIGKDKTATVDWNHDGKTEAEAYAKVTDKDNWKAGVKTDDQKVGDGTLSADASYTKTKTGGTAEADATWKDKSTTVNGKVGETDGKFFESIDGKHEIDDKTSVHASESLDQNGFDAKAGVDHTFSGGGKGTLDAEYKKDDASLTGTYKDTKWDANASLGVKDGAFDEKAAATYKLDDKTTLRGSEEYGKTGLDAKLGADHTFANGGKGTLDAEYKPNDLSLAGTYKDQKWDASGSVHDKDGAWSESLAAKYKLDDKTNLNGSLTHDPSSTELKLGGDHTFANGGVLTGSSDFKLGNGHHTESLTGEYKDTKNALDLKGSLGETDGQVFGSASASKDWKLSPNDTLSATAAYEKSLGKPGEGTFDLKQAHNSGKLVESAELEGGFGSRDYLKGTGSLDAQLGKNLYGGTWGSFTAEQGKHTNAELGASLTFTPSEKTALTLAGIVNESGQLETRLQYDIFKDRIDGVQGLAQHKKDAMMSLFLSVTTGGHDPGMLNDRYGAPKQDFGVGHDAGTAVMAGIKFNF